MGTPIINVLKRNENCNLGAKDASEPTLSLQDDRLSWQLRHHHCPPLLRCFSDSRHRDKSSSVVTELVIYRRSYTTMTDATQEGLSKAEGTSTRPQGEAWLARQRRSGSGELERNTTGRRAGCAGRSALGDAKATRGLSRTGYYSTKGLCVDLSMGARRQTGKGRQWERKKEVARTSQMRDGGGLDWASSQERC